MSIRASILGIVVFATACAGTGEFEPAAAEREAPSTAEPSAQSEVAPPRRLGQHDDPLEDGPTNLMPRNYNVTIMVADPAKAVDAGRLLLAKAGAQINNAERQLAYGSLNATVDRRHSEDLFQALRSLGKVVSESTGHNDMRTAMHELRRKLAKLELADMTVQQAIRNTNDHDVVDSLVTLLELSRRERESAWQQIQSYRQQGQGDQIYVTFQSDAVVEPEAGGDGEIHLMRRGHE